MAETQHNEASRRHGKNRRRAAAPWLDMTPMVDLAFLLLTFFVLAANLVLPKAMEVVTPKESSVKTEIPKDRAITILPGEDNSGVRYYDGIWSEQTSLKPATPNATGLQLRRNKILNSKDAPFIIINATEKAPSGKLVDVLDEIHVGEIPAYPFDSPTSSEIARMEQKK